MSEELRKAKLTLEIYINEFPYLKEIISKDEIEKMDLNQLLKTRRGFDLIISGRSAVNTIKKLYEDEDENQCEFMKN